MKSLIAAITLAISLQSSPSAEPAAAHHHHHHHGDTQIVEVMDRVARGSRFRAVCSKGDLSSSHSSRSAAVKAAKRHQKSTGHSTSVRKQ